MEQEILFGVCLWHLNRGKNNIILSGNSEIFEELNPHGKVFDVFECQEDSGYYEIAYGNNQFVILKDVIQLINDSVLKVGAKVAVKSKPTMTGSIEERIWHFAAEKTFYYLKDGRHRLSSTRYFRNDLTLI